MEKTQFKKHILKIKHILKKYVVEYPSDFIVKIEKGRNTDTGKLERSLRTSPFLILNNSKYIILYYVGTSDLYLIKKHLGISTNSIKDVKKLRNNVTDSIYALLEHLASE